LIDYTIATITAGHLDSSMQPRAYMLTSLITTPTTWEWHLGQSYHEVDETEYFGIQNGGKGWKLLLALSNLKFGYRHLRH